MEQSRLEAILNEQGTGREKLIPILQQVQTEFGYLPAEWIDAVAARLCVPRATVYAVSSFYEDFSFRRRGKFVLRLCDGTTCHSRGARELIEAVYEKLKISEADNTTADGLITVETVSCLGACALAPNMELNGRIFPHQDLESIIDAVEIVQMSQEEIDE
jgi:NADH-quinone oxidoreductase subunit E